MKNSARLIAVQFERERGKIGSSKYARRSGEKKKRRAIYGLRALQARAHTHTYKSQSGIPSHIITSANFISGTRNPYSQARNLTSRRRSSFSLSVSSLSPHCAVYIYIYLYRYTYSRAKIGIDRQPPRTILPITRRAPRKKEREREKQMAEDERNKGEKAE